MTLPSLRDDRARAALGSLSAIGAALAGFGAGVLFARQLNALALPQSSSGSRPMCSECLAQCGCNLRRGYTPSTVINSFSVQRRLLMAGVAQCMRMRDSA